MSDIPSFSQWTGGPSTYERVLQGETLLLRERQFFVEPYGTDGIFDIYLMPLRDEHGTIEGGIGIAHDNTRYIRAENALRSLTLHDPLTGIGNRRYLLQFIDREWGLEVRHRHPVAVIMADIDHFKAYNDQYGHLFGDECLRTVAEVFTAHVRRPTDLWCVTAARNS